MKGWASGIFGCQQTNGTLVGERYCTTSPVFFNESIETSDTATSFEEKRRDAATRDGISSRHGSHHVAQKLTASTRPFFDATTRARYCSGLTSFTGAEAAGPAAARAAARRSRRRAGLF